MKYNFLSMKVYVNQETTYFKKNPITINQSSDDESGTFGELQFLLQSNGYKLMSYLVAKKAVNVDAEFNDKTFHREKRVLQLLIRYMF